MRSLEPRRLTLPAEARIADASRLSGEVSGGSLSTADADAADEGGVGVASDSRVSSLPHAITNSEINTSESVEVLILQTMSELYA
jgi:hypothetical protein